MKYKPVKVLYIAAGFIALGLGAFGVVLPVLPTTPFLLLASFCFAKGSARFHLWFCATKLYKNHLESFIKSRAMTRKTKVKILIPASCMLLLAFIFIPFIYGKIAIGVIMCFKYYYFIFRIKTIPEKSLRRAEDITL